MLRGMIHGAMSSELITPWKAVRHGHWMATVPNLILYPVTALSLYQLIRFFNYGHSLSMVWFYLWVILTIATATPVCWMFWRRRIFQWREWLKQQDVNLEQTEKLAVNTLLVWPNRWFEMKNGS